MSDSASPCNGKLGRSGAGQRGGEMSEGLSVKQGPTGATPLSAHRTIMETFLI